MMLMIWFSLLKWWHRIQKKPWLQTEHFATRHMLTFNEVVNLYKLTTLKY